MDVFYKLCSTNFILILRERLLMNAKISVTRTAASLILCLALALPLAACGSSSSSQKTSTSDFDAKMASAYTAVLDDVDNGNYDFTNANSKFEMTPVTDGSKAIQYALQDIDGDGHPELLVRQPQTTSSEPTIQWNTLFFTYKSGKTAKALDGVVTLPSSTSARTAETSLYARDGGKGAYKRVYDASVSGDASDPKKDNTISYASITVDGDTIAEKDLSSTSTPKDIGKKIAFTDISGDTNYPVQMAAVALVSAPLFLVFIFLRKYIMAGVSRSGIKG